MAKLQVNHSVHFQDSNSEKHFLFQVLNFGKGGDELKFVFNHSASGTGGLYFESKPKFTGSELVRLQPEVTYHGNGTLHWKLPSYSERITTGYKDQHHRMPLDQIQKWLPFVRYTIVNYDLCKKPLSSNPVLIPPNDSVFDGSPFECVLFLGNEVNPTPLAKSTECVYRIAGVASNIDLLICIYKSQYRGRVMQIGDSHHQVWAPHNVIEIIQRR